MNGKRWISAAALVLAAATTVNLAEDPTWTLRLHGAILDTSAETGSADGSGLSAGVETGGGLGVGAEYRLSRRCGLEFSILLAGLEVEASIFRNGRIGQTLELGMMPLTLAVPIHLGHGRVDVYLAPSVSVVRYVNIRTTVAVGNVSSTVDVDSDTALGAGFGIDVPLGKGKWAFSAGLRVMKTRLERTDIDPVIGTVGFAYRF